MGARLFCKTGELADETHRLGTENVVGRNRENDVVLHSSLISERHARIYLEGDTFFLEDLGSSNGTWLDGTPVHSPVKLDGLNVVTFARTFEFIFQVDAPAGDAAEVDTLEIVPPVSTPESVAPRPAEPDPAVSGPQPLAVAADEDHKTQFEPATLPPLPDLQQPPIHHEDAGVTDQDSPPSPAEGGFRTMFDPGAFPPLPDLESEPQAVGEGHAASPPHDADPVADDESRTRFDGTGFPPLPELDAVQAEEYGLEVDFPDGRRETFALGQGRNTLGRSPTCDVTLDDSSVSRLHATLIVGATVTVEDAGSSNGTHLRGRPIKSAEIEVGSAFILGPSVEVKLTRR